MAFTAHIEGRKCTAILDKFDAWKDLKRRNRSNELGRIVQHEKAGEWYYEIP